MALVHRHIADSVLRSLGDSPVVFIQGARQTGKSTLVRSLIDRTATRYHTLDDATTLAAAQADPQGFVDQFEQPVAIDEVQRAPRLALAMKAAIDRRRDPGQFLLTGSSNPMLLPTMSDSLAGRMEIHTLHPLSQGELNGHVEQFVDQVFGRTFASRDVPALTWNTITPKIVAGGYPETLHRSDPERRATWFGSYLTTILHRDVRDIANIQDVSQLSRLLQLLASRAANLLDYSDLSRSLGMPQTTLKRYFALLEATFLARTIPAWFINIGKRLSKSPKVLINDSGLLCHLLGVDVDRLRNDRTLGGLALENFVALEVIRQLGWAKLRVNVFHFRTHSGDEVDLVLEDQSGRIVGIEVKATSSVDSSHFKGLRALADAAGDRFVRGVVLAPINATAPFGPQLLAAPISALWS